MAENVSDNGSWTVGHSNRDQDSFLSLLRRYRIDTLIDVRSYPNSQRFPQFNKGNLDDVLPGEGICYEHWPELGGYREINDRGANAALSEGFQAVAGYLNRSEGSEVLSDLTDRAQDERICLMCAEKEPRDCHRYLIADHLSVRGIQVTHILDDSTTYEHELHPNARVNGLTVNYPGLV